MLVNKSKLDPVLRQSNIHVEPEELVEPELEESMPPRGLRGRLAHYGNRVLMSGSRLLTTFVEAISNLGTMLAGSIVFLPLVIFIRVISILLGNVKSFIQSFFRLLFDGLNAIITPVRNFSMYFNKEVLFPVIKRIKEDDTTALIAFGVMVLIIAAIVFLISRL